jgi:hypothetical protein
MVQPTEVQFSWSEEHCRRRRRNRGWADLVFARVSVAESLESWQEGAFGEFVREGKWRANHLLRLVAHGHFQIVSLI